MFAHNIFSVELYIHVDNRHTHLGKLPTSSDMLLIQSVSLDIMSNPRLHV
jgi:hypothetical protein